MVRNCFMFNELGAAHVATYGAGSLYYGNFARASEGLQCRFVSRYMTATQVEENTPFCMDFDAPVCGAGTTPAPTSTRPTSLPTTQFQPLQARSSGIRLFSSASNYLTSIVALCIFSSWTFLWFL
jgi:hypothetical protein